MTLFVDRTGYQKPIEEPINKHVTLGIYYPLDKKDKIIVSIYNEKSKERISLFSKTLIEVSNILIESILQSSTFFFNKETKRKLNKRKTKKALAK
jgi:hypothetical protein